MDDVMTSKYQAQTETSKKPAKARLCDAKFRRRLKNISEWRKKRLAKLQASDNAEGVR
jgi:hypothetical protein